MSYIQNINELVNSVNRGAVRRQSSPFDVNSTADFLPVLSIRPKASQGQVIIHGISAFLASTSTTAYNYELGLFLNPTIGGTDSANWLDLTGSKLQYDISRTSNNPLSGGTLIGAGAENLGTVAGRHTKTPTFEGVCEIGEAGDVRHELVLAVRCSSTAGLFSGALNWREKL